MLAARRAHVGKKEDGAFNEVGEVNTSGRENRPTKARKQETAWALAPAHVGGGQRKSPSLALFVTITLEALASCGVTGSWLAHFGKKNVSLSVLL